MIPLLVRLGLASVRHPLTPMDPVIVCPVDAEVQTEDLAVAIVWWRLRGWHLEIGCGLDTTVYVSFDEGLPERGLSVLYGRPVITSAVIHVRDPSAIVLTHEFGHVLGFDHVRIRGHVMHPSTVGWDGRGLTREP